MIFVCPRWWYIRIFDPTLRWRVPYADDSASFLRAAVVDRVRCYSPSQYFIIHLLMTYFCSVSSMPRWLIATRPVSSFLLFIVFVNAVYFILFSSSRDIWWPRALKLHLPPVPLPLTTNTGDVMAVLTLWFRCLVVTLISMAAPFAISLYTLNILEWRLMRAWPKPPGITTIVVQCNAHSNDIDLNATFCLWWPAGYRLP